MSYSRVICILAIFCAVIDARSASAVNIGFSISSDSDTIDMNNGLDADVSVNGNTDTVDLAPNVPTDVFLQSGTAEVFQGFGGGGSGQFDLTLSITGATSPSSRAFSQDIFVQTYDATPFDSGSADVQLGGAASMVFTLSNFKLTVTPNGDFRTNQTSTDIPFSNDATFLLTPTPEPTCGAVLLFGAGMLLARRTHRKHCEQLNCRAKGGFRGAGPHAVG